MAERLQKTKSCYIKSWSEISSKLPDSIDADYGNFIRDYFRAQLRLAQGKRVKAGRIFHSLDKRTGFAEFEASNEPLLAAIDIAVRGETKRTEVIPKFEINKPDGSKLTDIE
ncbi:MAG: hypothetical protein US95_C0001G0006 [Candidatus Woesebacteria bacterium GW2011_GWB1_38_5]|uniref:Uncharacterized protein n=4 Tax=Candidatus Woeseibacteriota TaxID=1752722 RepID=A0A0G0KJ58_9BACT|nr:MAG: hypothetical protein US67_C0003G0028 [Candidatus Woesebacteria bacterium GW2011_GWD1_38_10]KKQ56968.1 MAG: hypothetical protein US75_C0001G0025 [Candidatus Woesebacteria bacterium GW2011_GWC1_38_13]KKQ75575.1 MAG: hypothetical protein US95_C0001G0006 [Candidatus Woesebacteria bacterium GW2011_GWB1_38_5]KKQ76234.1 MAG: hypothetical protein US97_C0016G0002 [Microgenomates group bacterium GW2011_GWF1_38_5]KKQ82572.1 MAG: hypothetical protein UT06_C0046G0004 [Candidatus Woesebacteria bacter